jgi:riboflavin synthase
MFTGIVETVANVAAITREGSNIHFRMASSIAPELKPDQSVAHNGVCLTVTAVQGDTYDVTAVQETLQKTNLGLLTVGAAVNLERSLKSGDRIDGHFVQGHVDTTGKCASVTVLDGSSLFQFSFSEQFAPLLIEKGSVCVNGVSLTVFNVTNNTFTVAIIPYTLAHTNLAMLAAGDAVNLEFDVLGKYILRNLSLPSGVATASHQS